MRLKHAIAIAIIVPALSACSSYRYGDMTFNNRDEAEAAQKVNLDNILRTESKPRNAPLATSGRIIIPSKALVSKIGVKSDSLGDIKGYRDYVATIIYNGLRNYAEGIRQRYIFEWTVIEEADTAVHVLPSWLGESVVYFYLPDDLLPVPREYDGWYYISKTTTRTPLPYLGPHRAGRLTTFIDKVEALVAEDLPERIAARKRMADKLALEQQADSERKAEAARRYAEARELEYERRIREEERIAREGDGSPDDLACKKRKLKPATPAYLRCRESIVEKRIADDSAKTLAEKQRQKREQPLTAEEKLIALAKEDPKVMELLIRMGQAPATVTTPAPQPTERRRGDGSPDDVKCQEFGWDVGTQGYAGCRQQLHQLRADQERYRQELAAYERRLEAYEREADQQRRMQALELSARLLGGGGGVSRAPALGPAPIAPLAPPSRVIIFGPKDRRGIDCTVQPMGATTEVYCN